MKNCGKRFHSEVGKFRFLNELIKVVSPKVRISDCLSECNYVFQTISFRHLLCVNNLVFVPCPPTQYLGSRSPEPVKKKVLELIFSWTLGLPDEAKISDAYQMLKKQGICQQTNENYNFLICKKALMFAALVQF